MAFRFPPPYYKSDLQMDCNDSLNASQICLPQHLQHQMSHIPWQIFTVPPPPLPPPPLPVQPPLHSPFKNSQQQFELSENPPRYSNEFSSELSTSSLIYSGQCSNVNCQFDSQATSTSAPNAKEYQQAAFRTKDEEWLDNWLAKRMPSSKNFKKICNPLKISQAKEYLQKCVLLLKQLEEIHKQLSNECETLSANSWNCLVQDADQKVKKVEKLLENFKNPKSLADLRRALLKRSKKRQAQKRHRLEHQEMIKESRAKRQQLHRSIDAWLEDMQIAVEKAKTEESLKKEADTILSDVTRKKAEARRQLALLSALSKLRQMRVKSASSKGQNVSAEHGLRFTKVVERLKELWEKQFKEYNLEEQGLRVMLSEAVDERDQSRVLREKRVLAQWEQLLFGPWQPDIPEFYVAAEKDEEAFINIRKAWDKFVVSADAPMSSSIPIGWVLPTNPSSGQWEAVLSSAKTVE